MSITETTTLTEGRDLILTRVIDASREKVFKAWTDSCAAEAMVCTAAMDYADG
jgi:uncharacterized protein YndB with AHSA1/START domain